MKAKANTYWENLPAKTRRLLTVGAVGLVMLGITLIGWSQATKKPVIVEKKEEVKEVKLGGGLLEKSQMLDSQSEVAKLQEQIKKLQDGKNNPQPNNVPAIPGQPLPAGAGQIQPPPTAPQTLAQAAAGASGSPLLPPTQGKAAKRRAGAGNLASVPAPPLPALPPGSPPTPAPSGMLGSGMSGNSRPTAAVTELGEYGDIAIVSGSGAGTKSQKDEDKKKGVKTVYLPGGSFMEATLISGLDAPTTESAKGHPVPVLLRVKAPAQLPSDVRANLRGCFVVADGKGNLATERAELTLVSMSCMDRKGNAVIDQEIKGWIVDEDGRVGLRGVVVAKMGAMIARSMLAGFLGGMGEAFKAASQTTSVSPLGVNTVNTTGEKAVFAGLGQGLSSAFTETQKFYMELARQTLPVISVGATKVVTLVIGKGVSLEVKKSIN